MRKVDSIGEYDFYMKSAGGDANALYNIVPKGSPAPKGGYRNMQYIEKIKGVKFPDRYQPTKHGMTNLYPRSDSELMKQNQDNINRMIRKIPASQRDTSREDIVYAESIQKKLKVLVERAERFLCEDEIEDQVNSLDIFTKSFIVAALWSSTDDNQEPLDDTYGLEDIDSESLQKIISICKKFQDENRELYTTGGWSDEQAGHDFWLTMDHQGAGFWDRSESEGLNSEIGKQLTDIVRSYKEFDFYVSDSGKISIL